MKRGKPAAHRLYQVKLKNGPDIIFDLGEKIETGWFVCAASAEDASSMVEVSLEFEAKEVEDFEALRDSDEEILLAGEVKKSPTCPLCNIGDYGLTPPEYPEEIRRLLLERSFRHAMKRFRRDSLERHIVDEYDCENTDADLVHALRAGERAAVLTELTATLEGTGDATDDEIAAALLRLEALALTLPA